jgi:FdhD protein
MSQNSIIRSATKKVWNGTVSSVDDFLAVEEPLEIRLEFGEENIRKTKSISVTMRTPGNDAELATGFLFTEGIIKSQTDIRQVNHVSENIISIELNEKVKIDVHKLERHFYTSSSCGVCGKTSIESVWTVVSVNSSAHDLPVSASVLTLMPAALREKQSVFEHTGGLHASALFDSSGKLILLREDVGRHNALDKLIGAALHSGLVPLSNFVLLLSGRAGFELVQKAAMAGIKIMAAVGAPSSLAAEMAKQFDMTLVGFLRHERFNIYCGESRIIIEK